MKVELSKRLQAVVRELAAKVHERELRKLLAPLAEAFAQWKAGKKDTFALLQDMDRINVPRQRLSGLYGRRISNNAPMMVAYALVSGLLKENEVPHEVLEALKRPIALYQQGLAYGKEEDD